MTRSTALLDCYPRCLAVDLLQETGVPEVDDYLFTLVNVLSVSVGEWIRAIYLIGSYANGSYGSCSDIDLCLVWKDGIDPDSERRAWSICTHVQTLTRLRNDPMYHGTEAPLFDPVATEAPNGCPCGPVLKLVLKHSSLLLWGEDVRPRVEPGCADAVTKDVIGVPLSWIDIDFSLDRIGMAVTWYARVLVFLATGEFVFRKCDVAEVFRRDVGGSWAELVGVAGQICYTDMPDTEKHIKAVWACEQWPMFKEHFLRELACRGLV